mmetsp:Transcript_26119/g.36003  ORF Transcript_26119/g.36003 Transcript_26119/m.36003 type:complete len:577 (-) Transcript_26119:612-2342(-)
MWSGGLLALEQRGAGRLVAHVLAVHPLLHEGHLVGVPVGRAGPAGILAGEALLAAEDVLQAAGLHLREDQVRVHGRVSVEAVLPLQGLLEARPAGPVGYALLVLLLPGGGLAFLGVCLGRRGVLVGAGAAVLVLRVLPVHDLVLGLLRLHGTDLLGDLLGGLLGGLSGGLHRYWGRGAGGLGGGLAVDGLLVGAHDAGDVGLAREGTGGGRGGGYWGLRGRGAVAVGAALAGPQGRPGRRAAVTRRRLGFRGWLGGGEGGDGLGGGVRVGHSDGVRVRVGGFAAAEELREESLLAGLRLLAARRGRMRGVRGSGRLRALWLGGRRHHYGGGGGAGGGGQLLGQGQGRLAPLLLLPLLALQALLLRRLGLLRLLQSRHEGLGRAGLVQEAALPRQQVGGLLDHRRPRRGDGGGGGPGLGLRGQGCGRLDQALLHLLLPLLLLDLLLLFDPLLFNLNLLLSFRFFLHSLGPEILLSFLFPSLGPGLLFPFLDPQGPGHWGRGGGRLRLAVPAGLELAGQFAGGGGLARAGVVRDHQRPEVRHLGALPALLSKGQRALSRLARALGSQSSAEGLHEILL